MTSDWKWYQAQFRALRTRGAYAGCVCTRCNEQYGDPRVAPGNTVPKLSPERTRLGQ